MYLAILILVITFTTVTMLCVHLGDWLGEAIGTAVATTVVMIFVLAVVSIPLAQDVEVEPKQYRQEVIALRDDTTLNGSFSGGMFVLIGTMSGSISEDPIYIYYSKDERGGIRQQRKDVDEVVLYEEEGVEPYVIRHICPSVRIEDGNRWTLASTRYECNQRDIKDEYELHVPPGTVVRDFRLDAE